MENQAVIDEGQTPRYTPSPPMQRDAEGWEKMEREIAGLRKSLAAVWHELRWIRRRV